MSERWTTIIRSTMTLGLLALVMVVGSLTAHGSTSANFELDLQATPGAADDAFSTNFHVVGVTPQEPAGDLRTSANFQLETVFVPLTFDPVDTVPPVILTGPIVLYTSDTQALIEWTTDELATGDIDFGLTTAYGSTASQSGGFTTLHQVTLTGLTPGTTYNARAGSTDVYNNGPTVSANFQFTTAAAPDTTAPGITPTVTFTATSVAQIDFTTSEAATTTLDHGPMAALGTSLPDAVFGTNHTRTIPGLTPGATHFFDITATDPSSNVGALGVQSFVLPDDVTIAPLTLPDANVGAAYTLTPGVSGGVGAITWTLDSGTLPPGFIVVGSTGELSGIPSSGGTFNFSIRATDSGTPASIDVVNLQLIVNGGSNSGGSGSSSSDEGCTTGENNSEWLALFVLLAGVVVVCRSRRRVVSTNA